MVMNNTYTRQVAANPTDLNPVQHYVEEYDAMAELTQQATRLGQVLINKYAEAKDNQERETAKEIVDKENEQQRNALREVQLNEDPDTWEAAYQKKVEKINNDLSGQMPSRYAQEYNKWKTLNDERNLMDLRYAKTKKTLDLTREKIFDRVERNARFAVGADDGYLKMLDDDTQTALKGALSRGVISKLQYDKAWRNYNESKTYNALNNRLLVDPEGLALDLKKNTYGLTAKDLKSWQKKADDELKINDLKNRTAENNMIETTALEALEILKNKKEPPQNLLNKLPEKTQAAMQKVRQFAVIGEDVPTDMTTYSFLNDLRQNTPERFKNINLYDYAGDLSGEDLEAMRNAQNAIVIGLDGKAKVNPAIKHNDDLLKAAHKSLELKDDVAKYEFDKLFDAEVRGYFAEKGRFPTQLEQEDIVNKLRKSVARRGWWRLSKEVRLLDEDDQPYVKFAEIPDNTKNAIYSMLSKHPNFATLQNLDDDDQEKVVEDLAGAYERPRDQWETATRTIINKWLLKAQEAK